MKKIYLYIVISPKNRLKDYNDLLRKYRDKIIIPEEVDINDTSFNIISSSVFNKIYFKINNNKQPKSIRWQDIDSTGYFIVSINEKIKIQWASEDNKELLKIMVL